MDNFHTKLWPVQVPLLEFKSQGADVRFDNASILCGYTIAIPNKVYDYALTCSRSNKIIIEQDITKNMYGCVLRLNRSKSTRCYYKIEKRLSYNTINNDLYQTLESTLTNLKRLAMLKARKLKAIQLESECESVKSGDKTVTQVNQLKLHLDSETSTNVDIFED
tara:strand:- start:95 stop:586 length:492 start_codon:yes stop_codon:yes gene_type:complete